MREYKILRNTKFFKDSPSYIIIILAQYSMNNAALIQLFYNSNSILIKNQLIFSILNQYALPQSIIQIPSNTLHKLSLTHIPTRVPNTILACVYLFRCPRTHLARKFLKCESKRLVFRREQQQPCPSSD